MLRRIALALGVVGVILAIRGTALAARTFVANAGHLDALFLWTILPLTLAVMTAMQMTRPRHALWTVWVAAGAQWGFVIAALWSLGSFFALSAALIRKRRRLRWNACAPR